MNSAWQVALPHQELVHSACSLTAFADRPHDERLATAHVTQRSTFGKPLHVWLRLNKGETAIEESVYLGDMPIMIGGGGEKPPALKEGKWSISTSVSHVEGVSEEQARAMTSMNGQYSLCVDAQNAADGLRLVAGKALDGDCTVGGFKAGSIMADNDSSLQVEMPTGKRSKIKAATVLLRFEKPAAGVLLDEATPLAGEIEPDFLWECVNDGEFSFLDFARDYYGHEPTPREAAKQALVRLKAMGAKKVSVLTPYMKPLTRLVVDYIEHEGIAVHDSLSLEIADNLEVGAQDPAAPAQIVQRLDTHGVDVVVISACVQMPSLASVQVAQDRLGIPVVSAAACTTWAMLKRLGLETRVPNAGALLSGAY